MDIAIATGAVGIVVGAANFVKDIVSGRNESTETKKKLEQIQNGIDNIQQNIKVVLSDIQWTQVIVVLSESVSTIYYQYNKMMTLDLNNSRASKAWVANLNTEEIAKALFIINEAMLGKLILLPGAIMQLLTSKLTPLTYDKLSQSRKWLAVDYLQEMLYVQGEGYAIMLNAYKVEGRMTDNLVAEMIQRFAAQMEFSAAFISPLSYAYQNVDQGKSYFDWYDDAPYVDTHEVVADSGQVVVGLQLYKKGNRIAIKIAQAIPAFNEVQEKLSSISWKDDPDWGKQYFKLKENYVDTNVTTVPGGMVVTGAALYQKGNRMAIKLLGTKIDAKMGALKRPGQWQDSPGWGKNYFKGKDVQYCDDHEVLPPKLSCVSGAAIYKKGSNRVAVEIYTVCCRYGQ